MAARRRRKTQRFLAALLTLAICIGVLLANVIQAPGKVAAKISAGETALPLSLPAQAPDIKEAPLAVIAAAGSVEAAALSNKAPEILSNQSPAVAASPNAPILYYAQSGDSLDVLALRFGVSVSDISSTASLSEHGFISEGQLLLIPARLENTSDNLGFSGCWRS